MVAVTVCAGCSSHKRANLVIPASCIDALYLPDDAPKNTGCRDLTNGHALCRGFEVEYHCVKVKQ